VRNRNEPRCEKPGRVDALGSVRCREKNYPSEPSPKPRERERDKSRDEQAQMRNCETASSRHFGYFAASRDASNARRRRAWSADSAPSIEPTPPRRTASCKRDEGNVQRTRSQLIYLRAARPQREREREREREKRLPRSHSRRLNNEINETLTG